MATVNRSCLLVERQTKRHQMRDLGSPDKHIIMHNLYVGYLMALMKLFKRASHLVMAVAVKSALLQSPDEGFRAPSKQG